MRNVITKEHFMKYYNENGQTLNLAAIGKQYGVSRQRAHQIFCDLKETDDEFRELFSRPIPKEELAELLKRNKTIKEIALHFGTTQSIIRSRMVKYSLDRVYYKSLLTESTLHELFVIKNMTDRDIAEQLKCSIHTIKQSRYQHSVYKERGKRK